MYFKKIIICFIASICMTYGNHKDSNINNDSNLQDKIDKFKQRYNTSINISIERMEKVKDSIQEVYERENKHTLKLEQNSIENLQIGVNDAKNQKEKEVALQKLNNSEYKTQLFLGLQIGSTFTAVLDNINVLPTINLKIGFQNFLGIASKNIGLKIYFDSFLASNVLSSLKNNPFVDFVDSSFSSTNINAEVMYEMPISSFLRFGFGGGFGVGYMTYKDAYWDKLNGFASNISLLFYFSFKDTHKLEIVAKTFFYHYGSYVTRKLDNVVQNPNNLYSSDFTQPINLSIGWVYVF